MKKLLVLIVLVLAGGGGYLGITRYLAQFEPPPLPADEEGFVLLFDGESLDGWRKIGGESTFETGRGAIIGLHGPGENTFLRTEDTYGDFILKMHMRWDEPGNSGVLFRAAQRDGDGRAFGYQYELDDGDRAWSGGLYDEARRGWLANLEGNDEARAAVRLDDWNEITIEARGAHIQTWLNGVPIVDVVDGFDAEGFIALQVHSGDRGIMRWANIRIKMLPTVTAAGEGFAQPLDWQLSGDGQLSASPGELTVSGAESAVVRGRRQLDDALVSFTAPACEAPSRVRFRQLAESQTQAQFAELEFTRQRASARIRSGAGEQSAAPVELLGDEQVDVRLLAVGDSVVMSIGEQDIGRFTNTGLPERGALEFESGCGDTLALTGFGWTDLDAGNDEELFYATLDNEPAPVLEPQEAMASFRLAPGFELELVAAEPLVEDPITMAWDEYGRAYVVELRSYMPDAYGTGRSEPVGQVVRLTDDDGDGKMDRSEVFLGDLINPRAVAVVNEGVLIGEPPNLWLCELPTPDALCTQRRSVGEYGSNYEEVSVEHVENGLMAGIDNWLYNSKSNRQVRLVDGELKERFGLFRGQWGISRDDVGRVFYNNNSNWVQGDLFAAEDLVAPRTDVPPPGLGEVLNPDEQVFSVRVNPGVNRAYLDGTLREDGRLNNTTGAAGLVVYRGDQFPETFRGDVFVTESAGNVVGQFGIEENGMALDLTHRLYASDEWGQQEFFGSTDERFRPVDARNGPDGALYIVDMYRGIIQDEHFLTEELRDQILKRELDTPIGKGRIWRLRHTDGKTGRSFPQLASASAQQRVAALAHPNGWVRDTAQRLLLAQTGEGTEALRALVRGDNSLAAIHALWTLEGRGELTRDDALAAIASTDTHRQIQALRAGTGLWRLDDLLQLADTELPDGLATQLAFALGAYSGTAEAQDQLLALLSRDDELPYVDQAVVRAVQGQELAFLPRLLEGPASAESESSRAMLATVAAAAYRTLRGPLDNAEPAPVALKELLALIATRDQQNAWQQVAMLEGLNRLVREDRFVPAALAAAPPIFTDSSVDEDNPLWDARLKGRRAFTWPGDELAAGIKPLSPTELALMQKGEAFYPKCGACHGPSGAGIAGLAPPLVNASWVNGPPEYLGRIILQGLTGPVFVNGEEWQGVMPPHGHLSELDDETLAGLMTYLRRAWGHTADPVTIEKVADIRGKSSDRSGPWTVAELETVAVDRGYDKFAGEYSVSFITFTVSVADDGRLHLAVPMYGQGPMDDLGNGLFSASAGGESVKLEFVENDNGAVSKFILYRNGEKIPVKREG